MKEKKRERELGLFEIEKSSPLSIKKRGKV
jgi:hypothetical protein